MHIKTKGVLQQANCTDKQMPLHGLLNRKLQPSRVACNDLIPLHYDSADLLTAGVGINVKLLLEIGKREQDRVHKRFLNSLKHFRVTK